VQDVVQGILIGRLGRDVAQVSRGGKSIRESSLAVGQRVRDPATGEWTDGLTWWFDLIDWSGEALCGNKGDQVKVIVSSIKPAEYTRRDGSKSLAYKASVESCLVLREKGASAEAASTSEPWDQ
jgi:single-stranded DNA-binding protein